MKTKLDLHMHTIGSYDCTTNTPDAVVKAVLDRGLQGVAITDHHHTISPGGMAVAKALEDAGLFAIRGCEYSSSEGHVLVFGCDVKTDMQLGQYPSMKEVLTRARECGGVAFPSHPFRGYRYTLRDKIYEHSDILEHCEVLNGQNQLSNPTRDKDAKKAAKKMELFGTGGSDAHHPGAIGNCFTEFDGDICTPEEFMEALRSGDFVSKKHTRGLKQAKSGRKLYLLEQDERFQRNKRRNSSLDGQGNLWESSGDGWYHQNTSAPAQSEVSQGYPDEEIPLWAYDEEEDVQEEGPEEEGRSYQTLQEEYEEVQAHLAAIDALGRDV